MSTESNQKLMQLQQLLTDYSYTKEQLDELEAKKDSLRDEIASLMHELGVNEITETNKRGETWTCAYSQRSSKSVDYKLLLEEVGQEKYDQIVSVKQSTSLGVRKKTKKSPTSSKTKQKPVAEDHNDVPTGNVS